MKDIFKPKAGKVILSIVLAFLFSLFIMSSSNLSYITCPATKDTPGAKVLRPADEKYNLPAEYYLPARRVPFTSQHACSNQKYIELLIKGFFLNFILPFVITYLIASLVEKGIKKLKQK